MQQSTTGTAHGIRSEIQGLRAVAVIAVLLFHVWPRWLPGGYVGVDVFFVISGFLITSLLLREIERAGRIDFGAFYLRRLRRLLPAATAVLAVVAVLTPFFLPAVMWKDTATEIVSSALYVENWRLAHLAVDYLGAEEAASPLQHYWSLSIEEQFYLFWPALVALLAWAARMSGLPLRWCLRGAFALTTAISLYFSIMLTATDPAKAYFVTHTRIWALSLGALLAVSAFPAWQWLRDIAGLAGLVCIVVASVLFSGATPFPGYAALLPVLGAVLVIAAGSSGSRLSAHALLSTQPFRWIGDASYSIYLWHWPIVVFYLAETGQERIEPVTGCLLIMATLGLSWFSKRYIEDRFRHGIETRLLRWPNLRLVAVMLLPVVLAAGVLGFIHREETKGERLADQYPGARALSMATPPEARNDYVPSLAALKSDRAAVYDNGCHVTFTSSVPVPCRYGDPDGEFKVFLIGDSHAANWIPALEAVANRRGWVAYSFTKSSCPLMSVMMKRAGKPYEECFSWGKEVRKLIAEERPDLVLLAQMYSAAAWAEEGGTPPSINDATVNLWRELMESGARVVAIADTPRWRATSPDACLARDRDCKVSLRSVAVSDRDPLIAASRREQRVGLIDMTDMICPDNMCPAVIGNIVVWRDRHHLTASYSRSMADVFGERIDESIAGVASTFSTDKKDGDSHATVIRGVLSCGPAGTSRSFRRDLELVSEGDSISFRSGKWEEREGKFERWDGTTESGTAQIQGEYVEGRGGVKQVMLQGSVSEQGKVHLTGTRGPRECSFVAVRARPENR